MFGVSRGWNKTEGIRTEGQRRDPRRDKPLSVRGKPWEHAKPEEASPKPMKAVELNHRVCSASCFIS